MNEYAPSVFAERQYFRQPWQILLLAGITGIFLYGVVQQIYFGIPMGNNPIPDAALIGSFLFTFLFSVCFLFIRLETTINSEGITVRFFPFYRKGLFYSRNKITAVYVRKYKPVLEYGGWGIRGFGNNRAFNVSGNTGIQIILNNNKKVLVGTEKPEDAGRVLTKLGYTPAIK